MSGRGKNIHHAPAKIESSVLVWPVSHAEECCHFALRMSDDCCVGPADEFGITANMIGVAVAVHDNEWKKGRVVWVR